MKIEVGLSVNVIFRIRFSICVVVRVKFSVRDGVRFWLRLAGGLY